jgi:hypothetical protein
MHLSHVRKMNVPEIKMKNFFPFYVATILNEIRVRTAAQPYWIL